MSGRGLRLHFSSFTSFSCDAKKNILSFYENISPFAGRSINAIILLCTSFSHSTKKGAKKSLCEVNNLRLIFCIDKVPFTVAVKRTEQKLDGEKKMLVNKNKHQEIPETWFKFIIFSCPGCCMNELEMGEKDSWVEKWSTRARFMHNETSLLTAKVSDNKNHQLIWLGSISGRQSLFYS